MYLIWTHQIHRFKTYMYLNNSKNLSHTCTCTYIHMYGCDVFMYIYMCAISFFCYFFSEVGFFYIHVLVSDCSHTCTFLSCTVIVLDLPPPTSPPLPLTTPLPHSPSPLPHPFTTSPPLPLTSVACCWSTASLFNSSSVSADFLFSSGSSAVSSSCIPFTYTHVHVHVHTHTYTYVCTYVYTCTCIYNINYSNYWIHSLPTMYHTCLSPICTCT